MNQWKYDASDIFAASPVVPVIVLHDVEDAIPVAEALIAGGINILELTLRTDCALACLCRLSEHCKDAWVGAGTVLNAQQLQAVIDNGAKFAISPGLTQELLTAGQTSNIPLIPGVSSISELMRAQDSGYRQLKFFPAEAAGGIKALKAFHGPFPDIEFCPTGGINVDNFSQYLSLPNVKTVGGSWLVPNDAIVNKEYSRITDLAKQAVQIGRSQQ